MMENKIKKSKSKKFKNQSNSKQTKVQMLSTKLYAKFPRIKVALIKWWRWHKLIINGNKTKRMVVNKQIKTG